MVIIRHTEPHHSALPYHFQHLVTRLCPCLRPYASRHSSEQSNNTATGTSPKSEQQTAKHVDIKSQSTTADVSIRQAITPPISLQHLHRVSPASKTEARPRTQLVLELSRIPFRQRLPSRITCKKCQRKHHTALHDDNIQARKRTSQSISQNQFSPQQQPNQTSLGASDNTTTSSHKSKLHPHHSTRYLRIQQQICQHLRLFGYGK